MKKSRSIVLALILLIPIFTITITTRATAILQLPSNINNNKNEPASSFLEYLPLNQGNRMLSYAMVALRPTNIISLAIQSPSSSSPSAARPPPSLTKALRSIMGNVVEEKDNNNNLTKAMITTTTTSSPKLNTNNIYYFRSNSKNNSSSPLKNKINPQDFGKGLDIALIKPTFTAAAYHNSFYTFYKLYGNIPEGKNITTHLDLLSSKITSKISKSSPSILPMLRLLTNIKSAIPKSNIAVLTDADVDNGSIFIKNNNSNIGKKNNNNNNNVYDIIILGHQEYVTQQEYNNLKKFVTNGGTMILLDGNVFYAEVKYDRDNQNITLVKGHGWAFNGKSAWRSVAERWKEETSQWAGSNYLCYLCKITFANDPFEYTHHEEQFITNPNDKILLNYNASVSDYYYNAPSSSTVKKPVIAAYELHYHNGKVIALGIYSDDVIVNDSFDRYFDRLLLLQYDNTASLQKE
jgi:hypothetical protein